MKSQPKWGGNHNENRHQTLEPTYKTSKAGVYGRPMSDFNDGRYPFTNYAALQVEQGGRKLERRPKIRTMADRLACRVVQLGAGDDVLLPFEAATTYLSRQRDH